MQSQMKIKYNASFQQRVKKNRKIGPSTSAAKERKRGNVSNPSENTNFKKVCTLNKVNCSLRMEWTINRAILLPVFINYSEMINVRLDPRSDDNEEHMLLNDEGIRVSNFKLEDNVSEDHYDWPLRKIPAFNYGANSGFQTALGKTIAISEKGLKAAQKLYEEICFEESEPISRNKSYTQHVRSADSEKNEDLKMLTNDFFDDIRYNDNDEIAGHVNDEISGRGNDAISGHVNDEISGHVVEVRASNSSTHLNASRVRVRKSLGGRRSFRPYPLNN